ncbi:cell wall surface anchor family protein [Streptococcus pneumoniae]|nr:cell wall surface anchor family protein [Streptococcus pneumoniae]
MKYFVPNEVFSIRKLKVGTCSVLLAISILGSQGILSDEVVTSSSPMATKESSNAITNDLDNSPTVNQNRSRSFPYYPTSQPCYESCACPNHESVSSKIP